MKIVIIVKEIHKTFTQNNEDKVNNTLSVYPQSIYPIMIISSIYHHNRMDIQ